MPKADSPSFPWKEVARSAGGWHAIRLLKNQKADPVSESANPSSQHQLYGSIVPIWTERRKVDLGWLLVIRLGCISPSAYYLHKMLQEQ